MHSLRSKNLYSFLATALPLVDDNGVPWTPTRTGVCVETSVLALASSCVRPASPGAMPGLNGVENFAFPAGLRAPPGTLRGVIPRLLPFPGDVVSMDGPGVAAALVGVTGTAVAALEGKAAGNLELEARTGFSDEPGRAAEAEAGRSCLVMRGDLNCLFFSCTPPPMFV